MRFKSVSCVSVVIIFQILSSCYCARPLKARIVASHYGIVDNNATDNVKHAKLKKNNVLVLNEQMDTDVVLPLELVQSSSVRLECVAGYPIHWVYTGPGHPNEAILADTRRTFKNFQDPNTYLYYATLYLLDAEEANTGKYSCRSLSDAKLFTYYYIYFPGKGPKFFVAESGRKVQGKMNADYVDIPCAISHPPDKVTVELFKLGESGHPEKISMTLFDPKRGFRVERKNIIDDLWGTYTCTCGNQSMTNSVLVHVLPPKNLYLRHTVKGSYVSKESNIRQRFICEGKSNVSFQISPYFPWGKHKSRFDYIEEPDSDFPFIGTLEAEPKEFANYSLISCILNDSPMENGTMFEGMVPLMSHTWEYSAHGNDKNLTFMFDKKLDSFICCTESSYVIPTFTHFRPCSSLQECKLRNHRYETKFELNPGDSLNKNTVAVFEHYKSPGSRMSSTLLPVGCAGIKRYPLDHDGFFRCSVPKAPFLKSQSGMEGEMIVQDYFYSSLKGKPVLSFEELESNEEIIVIQIKSNGTERTFKVNQEVRVMCKTNTFFFSGGHRWAFQHRNGTFELVAVDSIREEIVEDGDQTKLFEVIKFPQLEITHLLCLAPCWYSAEWKNSSLPVKIIPPR